MSSGRVVAATPAGVLGVERRALFISMFALLIIAAWAGSTTFYLDLSLTHKKKEL